MPDEPLTGTRDIDWVSSLTTTEVYRDSNDERTTVKHEARFAIEPGTVEDVKSYENSRFRPAFMVATWENGKRLYIEITGKRVLKGGDLSHVTERKHISYYRGKVLPSDTLPPNVEAALTAYETAVAVESGARK